MILERTRLEGVVVITPRRMEDERGSFCETYNRKTLSDLGFEIDFLQDNHSISRRVGTVRGLHYQTPPFAQTKLVRVARGAIFDVAVDIRSGSPTFGQWVGVELSSDNGMQLLVPAGFAHGFCTLIPDTEVIYKVDAYYSQPCDRSIFWNDRDIGIDWPIAPDQAVLSDKDARAMAFADYDGAFQANGE